MRVPRPTSLYPDPFVCNRSAGLANRLRPRPVAQRPAQVRPPPQRRHLDRDAHGDFGWRRRAELEAHGAVEAGRFFGAHVDCQQALAAPGVVLPLAECAHVKHGGAQCFHERQVVEPVAPLVKHRVAEAAVAAKLLGRNAGFRHCRSGRLGFNRLLASRAASTGGGRCGRRGLQCLAGCPRRCGSSDCW
jgi:hypothetical protein